MIIESLIKERERLHTLLMAAERDVEKAPKGNLRITHGTTNPQFYYRDTKSERNGIYITRDKMSMARALAQKAYAEKFEKGVQSKLVLIDQVLESYRRHPLEEIYSTQNPVRQQLIMPYTHTDEEIVANWLAMPYEPSPKYPENKTQDTANGEKVRSKSEVIIADNLKMMGIPYKYEAPVKIPGIGNLYPDFTCLNVRRNIVVYLEHFGKMGDADYRSNEFFWKLRQYEKIGIIQGKNLIMTFEDEDNPFNFSIYKSTIEHLLLN